MIGRCVGLSVEGGQGVAASPSQMGRFETKWLAAGKSLPALADLSGRWIDRVHARRPPRGILLDMDFGRQPDAWRQEDSVWNSRYECTRYHPLFVFNQVGDPERCPLRPGNVHSADGWEGVLKPVVARYKGKVSRIYFRADAYISAPTPASPIPKFASALKPRGSNTRSASQDRIGHLLTRPAGRPPNHIRRS